LSDKEYRECVRRSWERYYAFLGARVFHRKDKGFWKFHRKELGRLGYSLSVRKVAKPVLVEFFDLALNPLKTSMRIARKITLLFENANK
jgi:hypothetical protein